jgi:hypothetical protein
MAEVQFCAKNGQASDYFSEGHVSFNKKEQAAVGPAL